MCNDSYTKIKSIHARFARVSSRRIKPLLNSVLLITCISQHLSSLAMDVIRVQISGFPPHIIIRLKNGGERTGMNIINIYQTHNVFNIYATFSTRDKKLRPIRIDRVGSSALGIR